MIRRKVDDNVSQPQMVSHSVKAIAVAISNGSASTIRSRLLLVLAVERHYMQEEKEQEGLSALARVLNPRGTNDDYP